MKERLKAYRSLDPGPPPNRWMPDSTCLAAYEAFRELVVQESICMDKMEKKLAKLGADFDHCGEFLENAVRADIGTASHSERSAALSS